MNLIYQSFLKVLCGLAFEENFVVCGATLNHALVKAENHSGYEIACDEQKKSPNGTMWHLFGLFSA